MLIDRLMGILEQMEVQVGRLREALRKCREEVEGGSVYPLYQLIVKAEDVLRELRRVVYEECGGSAAAGPQHKTQR